jgi:hypothetical protein
MKYLPILVLCILSYKGITQNNGGVCTTSMAKTSSFTVGDIYIEGNTGILGSYFIDTNNLVRVSDINEKDEITIFPNPTGDIFKITSKNSTFVMSVEIYDNSARIIKNLTKGETYEVSTLPDGIYYVVINGNKAIKLIKQ